MTQSLDVSVVVESYNLAEGTSAVERFRLARAAASRMLAVFGAGELLVTDAAGDPAVAELLDREFPRARLVDARGLGYDEAKYKAAVEAASKYVVFLDGDCVPNDQWLRAHLEALRAGAHATTGVTRYDGGWRSAVESILDFGFMFPPRARWVDCYGSNNSGFRRDTLIATPPPQGPMRCTCYAHARELKRRGTPVRLVPDAKTRHEPQPLVAERYRQGFDTIASCWIDTSLPEARLLRLGVAAAPLFYARAVVNDWRRLLQSRRELGLASWQAVVSLPLFPLLRLIDLAGMVRALAPGGRASGVGLKAAAK